MRGRKLGWGLLVAALVTPAAASAKDGPTAKSSADEITALERDLGRDEAALAAGSCTIACSALDSMRRVADRLCEIEAGPRCEAARARVRAATRKVELSCPECGASPDQPHNANAPPMKPAAPNEPPPAPNAAPPAAELASTSKRGGCAACAIGSARDPDQAHLGGALLAALATVLVARRRRRR